MGNSTATQNPKSIFVQLPPSQPPLQAPNTTDTDPIGRLFNRPSFRVTSEFDSDSNLFLHKISYKFLENLAKLKLSFQNDCSGELSSPQLGLLSKYFSILYDFDSQNALVQGSFDVGGRLQFSASHDTDVLLHLNFVSFWFELKSIVSVIHLNLDTNQCPIPSHRFAFEFSEIPKIILTSKNLCGQMLLFLGSSFANVVVIVIHRRNREIFPW